MIRELNRGFKPIYFKHNKLLFLHPGKCAGTSVEHFLLAVLDEPLMPKAFKEMANLNRLSSAFHLQAIKRRFMFGLYNEETEFPLMYLQHADLAASEYLLGSIEDITKVAIVRNPFHRLLSAYFYNAWRKKMEFEPFVLTTLPTVFSRNKQYTVNHFGPQTRYTHIEGRPVVDLIMRKERFNESIDDLAALLGVKPIRTKANYQKSQASRVFPNYMDAYSPEMIDVVRELYAEDFECLGYV